MNTTVGRSALSCVSLVVISLMFNFKHLGNAAEATKPEDEGGTKTMTIATDPSNHPRLFFSRDEIPKLTEKVQHGIPKWTYELLVERCESLLTSTNLDDPRWAKVVDQPSNWNNARDILDLSLGYVISGNAAYRDLAIAGLMKVCEWPTWYVGYEPNRGLIVQAAGMAYDWLYEELGQDRAQKVAEKIAFECEQMSKFLTGADGKAATRRSSSMAPRTYGPFGVAAIALKDEYAKADGWIKLARERLGTWVNYAIDDDGAFYYSSESDYNTLALNGVLGFYIAYRRLTGENLCDTPRLRKNVLYQLYKLEPQRDGQGQFGVYARGGGGAPQNMVGLAAGLNDGLARWYYEHVHGPHGLKLKGRVYTVWCPQNCVAPLLWWTDVPIEYPDSSPRLGRAMLFRGSGKVVLRTGFESVEDIHFALECGPAKQGHSQADVGNYILNAYGERFIEDPGVHGGYEWGQTPEAHNLVLIDDVGPAVRGEGTIDAFIHTDFADYLLANQKPAYDAESPVERVKRHVVFVRPTPGSSLPSYFVVVDDVKKDAAPHRYELLLHTDQEREVVNAGTEGQFVMRGEKADLLICLASPHHVEMGRRHVKGVPPILSFAAPENENQGLFFTLLCPLRHEAPAPRLTAIHTGELLGVEVGEQDIVGCNRGDKPVTHGECTTDAKLFHARAPNGVSGHYLAVNATSFRQLGVGFSAAERITMAFKATRGKVTATKAVSLTLYYPGLNQIDIDGRPATLRRTTAELATIDLEQGEHDLRLVAH